ncbi:gamma-aminobutyric acid receptor alpha-like isoform X1 [Macrobrachium nipponense]|uniref:gamma-aminobutyric acid receptor alpha-like isoform X1 n=1 Tax=Macrobrachium nipponense TaxID=159736 RepID=UPI0030C7D886
MVTIDIEVRSMSQISEMDMTYSMDCYFRQSWVDERLAFSDLDEAFTLSVAVLEKLWKPDTFIYNGKQSYVHLLTTPNKFFRLYQNGKILYSSRLTINANCPMNLQDFPMDIQHCPLKLGSFAYTTRDVIYQWNQDRQVVIASDLMLSQFDLIAAPSGRENTTRRSGEYSTLMASFYLQRHMGNFLIQVYGPCMLLVVLSWVSFWLNREATSDRISLGITTVLTMTFLGLEARTDLPKVSYSTALDLFVWLSYGFIFATIIEFAFVHVFTKVGSGEIYLSDSSSEADSEEEEDGEDDNDDDEIQVHSEPLASCTVIPVSQREEQQMVSADDIAITQGHNGVGTSRVVHVTTPYNSLPRATICSRMSFICRKPSRRQSHAGIVNVSPLPHAKVQSHASLERQPRQRPQQLDIRSRRSRGSSSSSRKQEPQKNKKKKNAKMSPLQQMNSVSHIDEVSRVLFPLSFLCINFIYWYTFLSHSTRLQDNL